MRKHLMSLLLPFSFMASFAASAAEVVPQDRLLCTRDYNPWGQASECACSSDTQYEARLGACVMGVTASLSASGEISTQSMAIGGETTGFVLQSTSQEAIELILPIRLQETLQAAEGSGTQYQLVGDLVTIPGVERPDRPVLIVTSIAAQP